MRISEVEMNRLKQQAIDAVNWADMGSSIDEQMSFLKPFADAKDLTNAKYKKTAVRLRYCMEKHKELLKVRNYTQAQLSRDAHISRQTVGHIYTGFREPSEDSAIEIGRVLGFRAEYIKGTSFYRTEEDYNYEVNRVLDRLIEDHMYEFSVRNHKYFALTVRNAVERLFPIKNEKANYYSFKSEPEITIMETEVEGIPYECNAQDFVGMVEDIIEYAEFKMRKFAKDNDIDSFQIGE